jgi:hypothetical protein
MVSFSETNSKYTQKHKNTKRTIAKSDCVPHQSSRDTRRTRHRRRASAQNCLFVVVDGDDDVMMIVDVVSFGMKKPCRCCSNKGDSREMLITGLDRLLLLLFRLVVAAGSV